MFYVVFYGQTLRKVSQTYLLESGAGSAGDSAWEAAEATGTAKSGSIGQVLQRLRSKMYSKGTRDKIEIDADDQVIHVYSYCLSSHFDPLTPVFMALNNLPCIILHVV